MELRKLCHATMVSLVRFSSLSRSPAMAYQLLPVQGQSEFFNRLNEIPWQNYMFSEKGTAFPGYGLF